MKTVLIAGVAGAFLSTPFYAAHGADDLLTIVVTASRSAETVNEALVPVSQITRQDIERTGVATVSDALATVPGVIVSRNGGAGQTTSVFLRGTESDHVMVMIDGVRMGSATLGTTPFQDIPISQVEKIEVVRGPRSSLYGSEAIGGVIHIFTRRGGDGLKPTFSISGGSHNTAEVTAGVSGGSDDGWYAINASSSTTDGYNTCRGSFEAGCFTVEPDDDGYDNTSVSLRGGGRLGERVSLDAALLNTSGEAEFDGSFQNGSETLTRVGHVRAAMTVTDHWSSSLLLGQSTDESENFLDEVFASRFETNRDQVSWQNDFFMGDSGLIVGVDYTEDEVDSDSAFAVTSRDNTGVFASFDTRIGAGDLEVSIRSDDNEQFGTETTGGVAFGHDIGNGLRTTLSWGSAFKAPTFNELYFPGFGNPDLAAETAESIDLGIAGELGNGRWSVNLFHTEIENLIGFDPVTFAPVNIGRAEIDGIELAASTRAAGWTLGMALTLQDPKDTGGGANDGNQLPRRAEEILSLDADRAFGRWSVGGSIRSQGDSFDDLANLTELDGFTVVDLRAGIQAHKNWHLGIRVNNVFDEEYETAAFYPQDGTNVLATLRYTPE